MIQSVLVPRAGLRFGLAVCLLFVVGSVNLSAQTPQKSKSTQSIELQKAKSYLQTSEVRNGFPQLLIASSEAPQLISTNDLSNSAAVSEASSAYFTSTVAPILGVPADAEIISVPAYRTDILWQASYTLAYNGIPVRERVAHVNLGALSGKPMIVRSTLPVCEPSVSTASIDANTVRANALKAGETFATEIAEEPTLVYVHDASKNDLTLAYEVLVKEESPAHLWRMTYDANTGAMLEKKEMLHYCSMDLGTESTLSTPAQPLASLTGKVTSQVYKTSPNDSLEPVPVALAHVYVNGKTVSTDMDGNFTVTGVTAPYTVSTDFTNDIFSVVRKDGTNSKLTSTTSDGSVNLDWITSNSNDAERNAYYAVGNVLNYVKKLDPSLTALNKKFKVNVNLDQTCNAYYNPQDKSLNFFAAGSGCINTGLIPDVVYHEFGHRVNHERYQVGHGMNMIDGSLNEGFADVISALMRDESTIGKGFFGNKTTLRNIDNTKQWPEDLSPDIHVTGLIVAGAIWDMHKTLGKELTEKLFMKMEYLAPDGIGITTTESMHSAFLNVLVAMITVDDDDNNLSNGTPHLKEILAAFRNHNIVFSDKVKLELEQIPDQSEGAVSYPVQVHVTSSAPEFGGVNEQSVKVYYSTDKTNYQAITLTKSDGDLYTGSLPKVQAGSIVYYYATASLKLDDEGKTYDPHPENALSFIVGSSSRIFHDDAEQTNGWTLKDTRDRGATGRWVLDEPFGTTSWAGEIAQQDSDHTPNGTHCYITGNTNKLSQSTSINVDPVQNGTATLITPAIDLSSTTNPIVRFWYYFYSSAAVMNSTDNAFSIYVSSNNGSTWKSVRTYTYSYGSRWLPYAFRLKDLIQPSASVKLKIVVKNVAVDASTGAYALSEAGIDDIEIFDAPQPLVNEVRGGVAPSNVSLGEPFPNPIVSTFAIPVTLNQQSKVLLEIKDILGETVATPLSESMRSGTHTVDITLPADLPAGIYWAQLTTDVGRAYKKLIVRR